MSSIVFLLFVTSDFHTIKSILNLANVDYSKFDGAYFHTIKSILNLL